MKYNSKNMDFEVYVHLHDLHKILSRYQKDSAFDEEMNRHLELIRTKRYRVAVLGEFSRGKSSLINAMLGNAILPADILPATATINRVTFGLDPYVEIIYKDGEREQIATDAMVQYVTKLTENSERKAALIEEAVVYYPTVICQNHIDIIDTPGLNESEDMTFLTRSQLDKVDAAIVTISALTPLSKTEKDLILSLLKSEEIGYLIFAVSFIDKLDEEDVEIVLEHIRKQIRQLTVGLEEEYGADSELAGKAHRILDVPELYGISARKALKAFETNNNRLLKESRFPDFQKALYRILTRQQNVNAIYKTLRMMLGTGKQLGEWYQQSLWEMNENLGIIQEKYRRLEEFCCEETAMLPCMISMKMEQFTELWDPIDLDRRYRVSCVNALGNVQEDNDRAIEEALTECERRINEITSDYLEMVIQMIRPKILAAMNEFENKREKKLCCILEPADREMTDSLRQRMREYKRRTETMEAQIPTPFYYKRPDVAQIRHYNYITDLQRQYKEHMKEVKSCFDQMYGMLKENAEKTVFEDEADQRKILEAYRKYIHNVMTDKMLYERQYVNHQEEIQEIFDFCTDMMQEIVGQTGDNSDELVTIQQSQNR